MNRSSALVGCSVFSLLIVGCSKEECTTVIMNKAEFEREYGSARKFCDDRGFEEVTKFTSNGDLTEVCCKKGGIL